MVIIVATVHDVAAYIVDRKGPMTAMKLQKLIYYCQAWHLVWDEQALFMERIEAWANGPVVYELFDKHRGRFTVEAWPWGDPTALEQNERETVDAVLRDYGDLDARKLSHLTHSEAPWRNARGGRGPSEWGRDEISLGAMHDYYSGVDAADDAQPVEDLDWSEWEQDVPAGA